VTFTAASAGAAGNFITVELKDPLAASSALSVDVAKVVGPPVGWTITVNLATDSGSAVISTAAQIVAAIPEWADAGRIVACALVSGDGSGVVVPAAATNLAGGADLDYAAAYTFSNCGLQQAGWYNMLNAWFAGKSLVGSQVDFSDTTWADKAFSVWPRVNGDDHITMFRKMIDAGTTSNELVTFTQARVVGARAVVKLNGATKELAHTNLKGGTVVVTPDGGGTAYVEGTDYTIDYGLGTITRKAGAGIAVAGAVRVAYEYGITAAVVWGQNPAITEPNQSKVRDGLKNLDLLVVTEIFATETAQCDRKDGSITYLIPT
jgi:hypothetical protein